MKNEMNDYPTEQELINAGLDAFLRVSIGFFNDTLRKTIAVMKLRSIVAKLERDFEADEDGYKYEFYFHDGKLCISTTYFPASSIQCNSEGAAEALLKDNEELIKQALT